MKRDLEGRVAIVTGGNGGIGLGLAEALLDAGATVDVWGRNDEKTAAALEELAQPGRPPVTGRHCDVSDEAAVEQAFAATLAEHGAVHVMIANAGLGRFKPFVDTALDDWRYVTATDLDGVFLCFREAARHMKQRHADGDAGGSLVAVSSISAIHGTPRHAAYAASKAGLIGLVRSVAVELARYGVRSNAMLPGWTMVETHPQMRDDSRFVEVTEQRTPVRRWASPSDLAAAIVFLADPSNTFHTGDTLVIDGGYTIQ